MKYNQVELGEHFQSILEEKSRLIYISDSLGEKGSEGRLNWERYLELEDLIRTELKELFKGNNADKSFNEVHDAILCIDKKVAEMPKGYSAYIICCTHNSIMKYYNTIAVITTPNKEQYLIDVPTFEFRKIGEFILK